MKELTKRRIKLLDTINRKKKSQELKSYLINKGFNFNILSDEQSFDLIKKIKVKTKANSGLSEEYFYSSIIDVAKEVELFIGCHNYSTNIIFSHTDYYTSPFVNIDFNSWSEVLLNLLSFFGDSLRIYNPTSLITGALEYDKFEKRYVVDYGLWDCYSESYQNIYNDC